MLTDLKIYEKLKCPYVDVIFILSQLGKLSSTIWGKL